MFREVRDFAELGMFSSKVAQYISNRRVLCHSSPQVSSKIQIKKSLTFG